MSLIDGFRFTEKYGKPAEIEEITGKNMRAVPEIMKKQKEYSSWDWVFGKNPKFSFLWKGNYRELIIENGYIKAVTFGNVGLSSDIEEQLRKKILRMPFNSFFHSFL